MRLKINILWDFINVLVLKGIFIFKNVGNFRIVYRKYIGVVVNGFLLVKYLVL